MADITIVNLNLLYVRLYDHEKRQCHVPLGPLYVASALKRSGYSVDFRDYQLHEAEDRFSIEEVLKFLAEPAPRVGFSCMTNLLPFTLLVMRELKRVYPDRTLILAGVGPRSVERQILQRFEWVDIVMCGESEVSAPLLMDALTQQAHLDLVPGICFRQDGQVRLTPAPARIENLEGLRPAYDLVELDRYEAFSIIGSRGCPYSCVFCSVSRIWNQRTVLRSVESVVEEIAWLYKRSSLRTVLFQDEIFASSPERIISFQRAMERRGLNLPWKAFGRVDLMSRPMMEAMRRAGCVQIRFGLESGSNRILKLLRKDFTVEETIPVVRDACEIFEDVGLYYIWGFPFENTADFHQTLFQMTAHRAMGARILPSLLSLLPQTAMFQDQIDVGQLEFDQSILPESVITGHEEGAPGAVTVRPEHKHLFDFIQQHPDIFPGFFHLDLERNVKPKMKLLQEFGFYPSTAPSGPAGQSAASPPPQPAEQQ